MLGVLVMAAAFPLLPMAAGRASAQEAPPDTIPLDTLRVQVASRSSRLPAMTRSVQLLSRRDIQELPVRTMAELLDWATAVDVRSRSPAQSDLSVRGASFEQVVVLVDGVRMSDAQTGHFDMDLAVPLDRVARVEVLRGPASALYGADAMGGVVNIITRDGAGGWDTRAEAGSWGTARLALTGGVQHDDGLSMHAGAQLSRSDGHRPGTDYDVATFQAGASHPAAGGTITGRLGLARRDFGAADFYAPYPSYERTRTATASGRWTSAPGNGAGIQVGASYRRHDDDFILVRDDPALYRNRHTSSSAGADALVRTTLAGLSLAIGGELYRDALTSNSLGDRTEDRGAVFGEAVLGRGAGGILSLGLREDWHQRFGAVLSPSISASHDLGTTRLRAALGRSFRTPTWTERYYADPANIGRPDLAPETAWSGEVGVDLHRDRATVGFTAFVRRAENLIDWARSATAPDSVPWETRNVESATFRGLEADMAVEGPFRTAWTLGGTLLTVQSREAAGLVSKYALRPLARRFTIGVRRTFARRLRLDIHVMRARRTGETDPYHRLDARAALDLGPVRLYLDGTNLLDAVYPDVTGAAAPGRAVFLGLGTGP